jgi:hypothetical protein
LSLAILGEIKLSLVWIPIIKRPEGVNNRASLNLDLFLLRNTLEFLPISSGGVE